MELCLVGYEGFGFEMLICTDFRDTLCLTTLTVTASLFLGGSSPFSLTQEIEVVHPHSARSQITTLNAHLSGTRAPDGGLTLTLLGGGFTLLSAIRRERRRWS